MGNKRRRYNDEEKAGYISRLLHGESLQEISRKEGINYILLCRWRKEYQENGEFGHRLNNKVPATVTFAEAQAEIKRLRIFTSLGYDRSSGAKRPLTSSSAPRFWSAWSMDTP